MNLSRAKLGSDIQLGSAFGGDGPVYDIRKPFRYAWVALFKDSASIHPVNSANDQYNPDVSALAYGFGVMTLSEFLGELGCNTDIAAPTWDEVFSRGSRSRGAMQRQQQQFNGGPRSKPSDQFWGTVIISGLIGYLAGKASS